MFQKLYTWADEQQTKNQVGTDLFDPSNRISLAFFNLKNHIERFERDLFTTNAQNYMLNSCSEEELNRMLFLSEIADKKKP